MNKKNPTMLDAGVFNFGEKRLALLLCREAPWHRLQNSCHNGYFLYTVKWHHRWWSRLSLQLLTSFSNVTNRHQRLFLLLFDSFLPCCCWWWWRIHGFGQVIIVHISLCPPPPKVPFVIQSSIGYNRERISIGPRFNTQFQDFLPVPTSIVAITLCRPTVYIYTSILFVPPQCCHASTNTRIHTTNYNLQSSRWYFFFFSKYLSFDFSFSFKTRPPLAFFSDSISQN